MLKIIRFFILIGCCLWIPIAHAHKVKIFATADDSTVNGYVYFPGGGRAQHATIIVTIPPNDTILATVQTNEQGEFSYVTQQVADHLFTVDTSDGHRADYVVKASELNPAMPSETTVEPTIDPTATNDKLDSQLIEKIVYKQIQPLREQLEQYEEKIRIHDILGGIGYIFGIFGLMMYLRQK